MADVREQLMRVLVMWPGCSRSGEIADNILMHFEVTPKPAISAHEMGKIMRSACLHSAVTDGGQYALDRLAKAGLKIVRVDE